MSIKIAYKDKNYLLSKGLDSLEKLTQDFSKRFPEGEFPHGITFRSQGKAITSFDEITQISKIVQGKAIKLEAEQNPAPKLQVVEEEKKVEEEVILPEPVPVSKEQIKQELKKTEEQKTVEVPIVVPEKLEVPEVPEDQKKVEEDQKEEIKIEYLDDRQYQVDSQIQQIQDSSDIPLYQSEVKDKQNIEQVKKDILQWIQQVDEEKLVEKPNDSVSLKQQECASNQEKCVVSKSELNQLINSIVQKKVSAIEERMNVDFERRLAAFQKQIRDRFLNKECEFKQDFKIKPHGKQSQNKFLSEEQKNELITNTYAIDNEFKKNKKELFVGETFVWLFSVQIKNKLSKQFNVCIIEQRTGAMKNITLKSSSTWIEVGPFEAQDAGKFSRNYRLCYVEEDNSIVTFGPKFGFSVDCIQLKPRKVLNNQLRNHVEQLKGKMKINRSTEYLMEKLKQIGIDQDNYAESIDLIPDIFGTL